MAIRDYLHAPDILAVQEMENLTVLQDLAARIGEDAIAAGQPDPQYAAYLEEGNDVGGIDVGYLVSTAEVGAGIPRVQVLGVTQEGKATTWIEPDGDTSLLNDRPPLLLQAQVNFSDGRSLPLTAIVVHQRSLNSAEEDSPRGVRVRAQRQEQARFLADLHTSLLTYIPPRAVEAQGNFSDGRSVSLTEIVVHQRTLNSAGEDGPSGVGVRAKSEGQARFVANLVQGRQVADPSGHIVVLGDLNAFEVHGG